jgi:TonB-linked SusC/RagA family outer membrane protein
MKQKFYLIAMLRRTAVLLACGLPALVAHGAPIVAVIRPLVRPAADVPVSGRVTGPDGAGLPGVTILVRGTSIGTSTNSEGAFSLTAPEGSTLVFSFVGFTTQSVVVSTANAGSLNINLLEDTQKLNEVVVVGYGTQQRGSVTGAISSVGAADIVRQPVPDVTQAIQGKVSGVTITSNGGAPGGAAGTSVRVRGITSNGNNNPLYVLDGFPLPQDSDSQLNAISPNDIESIDVLKDASATAIYGVRAANGVVIITTKRGKAGQSNVNIDAYRGIQSVARKLDLLNAQEYAVINNEGRIAASLPIVVDKLRDPAALGEGTNWEDLVFRKAQIQNYALSANGGSDKARYAVSATYFQQDGTIVGSNFERYTLRANGDVQVGRILKLGNNIQLTHLQDRQVASNGGGNNNEYGLVQNMLRIIPTVPAYRPDGYWYEPSGGTDNFNEANPLAEALRNNSKFTRNRALTTFFAELEPVKGLRFRTNVGADFVFENLRSFAPAAPTAGGYVSARYSTAGASATSSEAPTYLIENTATYDHLFGDKHQLTLLAGQSAQEFNYSNVEAYRTNYLRNDLQTISSGPTLLQTNAGNTTTPQRLASYFGRLNYEFAGKYLFSSVLRYDGSSVFPPGSKFGFFPGVSAGWRISEEEFLKGNQVISNLKLRAGYGKVGNPLNAGRYAYLYSINFGARYPFGPNGDLSTGGAPVRLPNPDLRWENNNQTNIGLDMGFLDNRIEATIDLYNRSSPNLIAGVPVSYASGTYENVNTNAASAYNRGVDFSLTTHNFTGAGGSLNWSTTLNVSAYKTLLESLGAGKPYDGPTYLSKDVITRFDVGQAFGSFFGYTAEGLFQTPEEVKAAPRQEAFTSAGDIRFKDLNGDGVINASDRSYIGNPNPNFTFGMTNTLTYKGFDLSFFIQGVQGNDVYNLNRFLTESALYSASNGSTRVLNRWTGPGTSNDVPRAVTGDPNRNLRVSTYYIEDGSYVRLKNLTFGYSLPQSVVKLVAAKQLRVYFTAQNLVTLTKYTGFDPEVSTTGIDIGVYPQSRVLMGGVNIGF